MKTCNILIQKIEAPTPDAMGLSVQTEIEGCSFLERLVLVHALAEALELNSDDIMMVAICNSIGLFKGDSTTVDLSRLKEHMKNES